MRRGRKATLVVGSLVLIILCAVFLPSALRWAARGDENGISSPILDTITSADNKLLRPLRNAVRRWTRGEEEEITSLILEAVISAGNFKLLRPLPYDSIYPDGGVSIACVLTGRLDEGMAGIIENNDAAFWITDNQIYAVNDEARKLLPNAPLAPSQITEDAVRRVAK